MDLFSRFKKDYLNYLISIIIPVIITAVSIPLFKHILGSEGYGNFSITFNSVLLCTAILSGWIWPSIIRYFPASLNKRSFARQSMMLSGITQSIFALPVLVVVWYIKNDIILAVFFSLTLFLTSLQFSVLALSQSVFLSKKSIYAELMRSVSYMTTSLLLLKCTHINYMYALFISVLVSYLISFTYLSIQSIKQLRLQPSPESGEKSMKSLLNNFMVYGSPLSLWFVFASLISLTDKYFILKTGGAQAQGNYQAMFDFLSKSITIFISPVTISLFPLLTTAFHDGKTGEINKLLKTILGLELAGLLAACILYWWFGADILFTLIKTPGTAEYKQMGLFIIAGTFIWQMAIVMQKRYELKFKSLYLLAMVSIAFLLQLLLYILFNKCSSQLLYPIGYATASVVYLFLVSFSAIGTFFKKPLY